MRGSPGIAAATLGAAALILGAQRGPAAAESGRGLSLAEAVRTAIANDAEVYISREDARITAEGVALTRSAFTRRLFGEIYATHNAQPPSATSFRAVDTIAAATLGIAGRVETGLTYTVSGGLARQERDDPFSTFYDGATTTTVHAEVVHPLLRGSFPAARRPDHRGRRCPRNPHEHQLPAAASSGTLGGGPRFSLLETFVTRRPSKVRTTPPFGRSNLAQWTLVRRTT